jgi:hypothetical protein
MRSDSFLLLRVLRAAPSLLGSAVLAMAVPIQDTHNEQLGLSVLAVLLISLRQPVAPSYDDTFHASYEASSSLLN